MRLIDADQLKEMRNDVLSGELDIQNEGDLIDACSTVNAVKIVRCKGCEWYCPYNKPVEDFDGWCYIRECETDEKEFCSYGKKKERMIRSKANESTATTN